MPGALDPNLTTTQSDSETIRRLERQNNGEGARRRVIQEARQNTPTSNNNNAMSNVRVPAPQLLPPRSKESTVSQPLKNDQMPIASTDDFNDLPPQIQAQISASAGFLNLHECID